MLFDAARLAAGEVVLIRAATGGVGSVAAWIARSAGAAAVFGTVGSPGKQALAAGLGYDALLPREDFGAAVLDATSGRDVDVVLDPRSAARCGRRAWTCSRRSAVLSPTETSRGAIPPVSAITCPVR